MSVQAVLPFELDNNEKLLFIKTPNQQTIISKYEKNKTTIKHVIEALKNKYKYGYIIDNVLKNDIILQKNGEQLQDHKNLEYYGISSGNYIDSIDIIPNKYVNKNIYNGKEEHQSVKEEIEICIITLSGKTINIIIPNDQKVINLKYEIYNREGIPPEQSRLIYSGHQLHDQQKLDDYKIVNGATIHLVLRLKGGMFNEVSGRNGGYEKIQSTLEYILEIDNDS
jgi:hypothetical protein